MEFFMGVTVLLEVKAKAGTIDQLMNKFSEILPDTRSYDGNIGIELVQNQEDANILVAIEQWDTRAQYEKYLAWRQESGTLAEIVELLDGPPNIRYFSPTGA
tara:strand:- start:181 stop:486 length:306 start_codon:yes stop_codon:yes gene_type:complete